jgi:hypothetical protein
MVVVVVVVRVWGWWLRERRERMPMELVVAPMSRADLRRMLSGCGRSLVVWPD